MEWKDVLAFLEAKKDSKEYKALVAKGVTLKTVQAFLKDDVEGVKWLQGERDRAVTNGIKTFKDKTLPGLIEEATKGLEKAPTETEKRIKVLEDENKQTKAEAARLLAENRAISLFTEKGLPASLAKFFVADDDEATDANIKIFEDLHKKAVDSAVTTRLKENPGNPENGDKGQSSKENPWKKDTFNLTKQGEITKKDSKLAGKLKAEAAVGT